MLDAYQPPTFTENDVARWVRFMGQAPANLKPWLRASFPLFLELGPDKLAALVEDCAESLRDEACRPGTGFWHLTQLLTKYASEQPPQTAEPAGDLPDPQGQTEQATPLELISQTVNNYNAPDGADCEEIPLELLELLK